MSFNLTLQGLEHSRFAINIGSTILRRDFPAGPAQKQVGELEMAPGGEPQGTALPSACHLHSSTHHDSTVPQRPVSFCFHTSHYMFLTNHLIIILEIKYVKLCPKAKSLKFSI